MCAHIPHSFSKKKLAINQSVLTESAKELISMRPEDIKVSVLLKIRIHAYKYTYTSSITSKLW